MCQLSVFQEIIRLESAALRPACIMRPNNRAVLNESIPIQERTLLPTCQLARHLMLEDFGWASPLHGISELMGITTSVYDLPIDLMSWTPPYPVNVKWPVIEYGSDKEGRRRKGYLKIEDSKCRLRIYGEDEEIVLASVREASMQPYCMGPRPMFCTPFRGIKISSSEVGVLMPLVQNPRTEHPASRYYDAEDDSYAVWSPKNNQYRYCHTHTREEENNLIKVTGDVDIFCRRVDHDWVESRLLPMCSPILIKAGAPSVSCLVDYLDYHCGSSLERDGEEEEVFILGRIVPPRQVATATAAGDAGGGDGQEEDCCYESKCVWVSIELRHTIGYLKGMPFADMGNIKIPVEVTSQQQGVLCLF